MVCRQVELRAARWRGVCPPSVTVFTGTPPHYTIVSMPNNLKKAFLFNKATENLRSDLLKEEKDRVVFYTTFQNKMFIASLAQFANVSKKRFWRKAWVANSVESTVSGSRFDPDSIRSVDTISESGSEFGSRKITRPTKKIKILQKA
jgi:hypothetical protein